MSIFRFARTYLLASLLLLTACTFTGNYNSDAHRQLVMLQALHMQFIDDAALPGEEKVVSDDREMRLQFRTAQLFAESLGDPLRLKNMEAINTIYQSQYQRRMQQNRPFRPKQAALFRQQATLAWQQAIYGECLRPRSPCK